MSRPIPLLLAGVAALVAAAPALAQQPPAARFEKGQRWSFSEETTVTRELRAVAVGQPDRVVDSTSRIVDGGEIEIVDAARGTATVVRVSFSPAGGFEYTKSPAPPEHRPHPYAGQTVTVRRTEGGGQPVYECPVPLPRIARLDQLVAPGSGAEIPAVGEKRTFGARDFGDPFGLGAMTDGTVAFSVRSHGERAGRRTAIIDVAIDLQRNDGGLVERYRATGTTVMDAPSGFHVSTDIEGELTIEDTRPLGAGDVRFSGGGHLVVRKRCDLIGGAAAARAPPAVAGATPTTPEGWFAALVQALKLGDYAAFERLHTQRARGALDEDVFARVVARAGEIGTAGKFTTIDAETVRVTTQRGRPVATLKRVGSSWLADSFAD